MLRLASVIFLLLSSSLSFAFLLGCHLAQLMALGSKGRRQKIGSVNHDINIPALENPNTQNEMDTVDFNDEVVADGGDDG